MAHTSLVRDNELAQKKGVSVFAARLKQSASPGEGELGTATANYKLANLPSNAIILNAFVMVNTASDAATSCVGTLGTTETGTEVLSAADLTTAGKEGTFTGEFDTSTGVELFLRVATTGAATAVGDFTVVVEYLEYEKNNGEYTNF